MNDNKNIIFLNWWDIAKVVLTGNFIPRMLILEKNKN